MVWVMASAMMRMFGHEGPWAGGGKDGKLSTS